MLALAGESQRRPNRSVPPTDGTGASEAAEISLPETNGRPRPCVVAG